LWLTTLLAGVALLSGCTRCYYRNRADKEVNHILKKKDQFPYWQIEQYHVYPDPRARFGDPTNPDKPPMPPDDLAAKVLSPEGDGWLQLMALWDAANRAARAEQPDEAAANPLDWLPGPRNAEAEAEESSTRLPGYLLNLEQSSALGLINSREFQTRRENLYLTALPVTLERFAFIPHFFAVGTALREYSGRETPEGLHNRWDLSSAAGLTQFFPTGAMLLFQIANRTVVEMAGNFVPHTRSESILTLDVLQPFLRGGGFAVNMEPLTQAERDLLYEMRRYARFRKEFFVALAGGGNLAGGADVPRGFESVNLTLGVFPSTEGYLPTLLRQSQLLIEQQNVAALEIFLRMFRDIEEGGDIAPLQVGQVEQDLLRGQSTVLQRDADYRDSLDRFKLLLGVPPGVGLELDESPLRDLTRQLQRFAELLSQSEAARNEALQLDAPDAAGRIRQQLRRIYANTALVQGTRFQKEFPATWARWERVPAAGIPGVPRRPLAVAGMLAAVPLGPLAASPWLALRPDVPTLAERLHDLAEERRRLLDLETDLEQKGADLSETDRRRLEQVNVEIAVGQFEQLLRDYERQPWLAETDRERQQRRRAAQFRELVNRFVLVLGEARDQRFAQLRKNWPELLPSLVDGVDVVGQDLDVALDTVARAALVNRFDLMNQHGLLVDAWRKIAVAANALLGVFNVRYHLDSFTPIDQAQPLNFGGSRNRHQLFLDGELPLVRLPERNVYRATLIAYQRQRRDLMAAEDRVAADVRSELRQLRVLAQNYKIQQRAVEVAYDQVESSLETFLAPPQPPGGPHRGRHPGRQHGGECRRPDATVAQRPALAPPGPEPAAQHLDQLPDNPPAAVPRHGNDAPGSPRSVDR
jgi:hypothetical protein